MCAKINSLGVIALIETFVNIEERGGIEKKDLDMTLLGQYLLLRPNCGGIKCGTSFSIITIGRAKSRH